MVFRQKRANDAPPTTAAKKTYQAVAVELRGMPWLEELMRRSHDHCRLLESPLKIALRARHQMNKHNSSADIDIASLLSATHPHLPLDFPGALRLGEKFLQPNQLEMRDRLLESCNDAQFLHIMLSAIEDLPYDPQHELESVKVARRKLRKLMKTPPAPAPAPVPVPATLHTSRASSATSTSTLQHSLQKPVETKLETTAAIPFNFHKPACTMTSAPVLLYENRVGDAVTNVEVS